MFYFAQCIKYLNNDLKKNVYSILNVPLPMTLIRMRNIVSSILHLLRNLEFVAQAKRVAALYSKLKLIYRLLGPVIYTGF